MQISEENTCVGVFFNKTAGPQNCEKKEIPLEVFSYEICKIFKNTLFCRTHFQLLFLTISGFQPATLLKRDSGKDVFCEFCKIFKNIFWQNTSGWLLLVFISEFWEVFCNTSFMEHLWETAYFMYKLQNFNHKTQPDSKKLFHRCVSSILYKNEKWPFEGVHLLKGTVMQII